ncbi:MAG: electron transfer flavoprotein subunit alpha/FixB family protein [Ignavibacteriaceae bacterium]|nr:electron transfer flavoprotein subunit alpha/FixB family protein [Ignavibacteriaceae bacterium]
MAKKIIGILEQREGKLKKSSFEILSLVFKLASELKLDCEAVAIGNEIENLDEISKYGVSNVTHYKNEKLELYSSSAYTGIITNHAKENDAAYLIFPDTAYGRDLAPRVSARLNAGCIIDCIKVETLDGDIKAIRPVYAGKALIEVKLNSAIKILTIRPNVLKPVIVEKPFELNITVKDVSSPDLRAKVVEIKKSDEKLDVAEADIIVSGGRGLKSPENFSLVENLAEALGGAVGASRAVVDAGWRPHSEQIGQTGKTVSPSLYVACGISGAIQHLAGMSSSKYIVAINKDKDAPIFSVADYGIAGDVFDILPALTNEIKKIKI